MDKTTNTEVPNPGKVEKPADVKGTGSPTTSTEVTSGKTADEREALKVAAEKGADKPAGSEDKAAKGIEPAKDPAQRIDEMTNNEAKAYSAAQNAGNAFHTGDEDRPAGDAHTINTTTGKRTAEGEAAWRDHYSKGWNDFNKGDDQREDYRGGPVADKDAYLSGYNGAKRESQLGHQGGDMKRGDYEKARVSGAIPTTGTTTSL